MVSITPINFCIVSNYQHCQDIVDGELFSNEAGVQWLKLLRFEDRVGQHLSFEEPTAAKRDVVPSQTKRIIGLDHLALLNS